MESTYGLTEYASGEQLEIVPCILKEMYSDFIVEEILEDKSVLTIPSPDYIVESSAKNVPEVQPDIETPKVLSEEIVKQLDERFLGKGEPVKIETTGMSKDERKTVHKFVREKYSGKLISETKDDTILVSHGHTQSSRKRKQWDENIPKETHFTMCKENKDTSYALGIVAKFLGVRASALKTHGIKDKRGVTSQRVSGRQITEQQILKLNSILRQIIVLDVAHKDQPIQMGGHWGNRFSIILRNLPENSEELLKTRLASFKNNGFINYFGTQRFGSREATTAEIGLCILRRDWENAVKAILNNALPQHLEDRTVGAAIRCLQETGNVKIAFSKLKGAQAFATIEGMILNCLMKGGTWQQCITDALPIQTRSLYVHAYQSLIWNRVASRRVKELDGANVNIEADVGCDGFKLDEKCSHYHIHIPLAGENEAFKESLAYKWSNEELQKDDITPDAFNKLQDRFSLGASSRPLFVEAENLEYQFIRYPEPRSLLQDGLKTRAIPESERTGPYLAVQLKFDLVSGSYATVALREITGEDMSKNSMKAASYRMKEENGSVTGGNMEAIGERKVTQDA